MILGKSYQGVKGFRYSPTHPPVLVKPLAVAIAQHNRLNPKDAPVEKLNVDHGY